MIRTYLFAILMMVGFASLQAQTHRCATHEYMEAQQAANPDYLNSVQRNFDEAKALGAQEAQQRQVVITIPVVVHVLYRTATQNISDAQIQSQIDVLNRDYTATNTDYGSVPSAFSGIKGNPEIEFCLASSDPNGNATTGITRTSTTVNGFSINTDDIKSTAAGGMNAWPNADYMNIWVGDIDAGILGYATPPFGSSPSSTDGVVIDYLYFGTIGTATAPYNGGRTATHEVGHYLGLPHVWGSGAGGCSQDDGIADTPTSDSPYYGCPSLGATSTTCGSQDMFMNYMDYVNDACMFTFSQGQIAEMRGVLNGFRSQLVANAATACNTSPPPPPACYDLTIADYTMGFEATDNTGDIAIENVNGDANTWSIITDQANGEWGPRTGTEAMIYLWNSASSADDWFFTECFAMKASSTYELTYWYAAAADASATYPENLSVGLATSSSSSNLIQILANHPNITNTFNTGAANNGYVQGTVSITVPIDGNYNVGFRAYSAADQYALQIDDINITETVVSVNEQPFAVDFSIFPNPASDVLNISWDGQADNYDLQLIDALGRTMKTETALTNNHSINVQTLAPGIYMLRVQMDGQSTVRKIVIR